MVDPLTALLVGIAVIALCAFLIWPKLGLITRWRTSRLQSDRILTEDVLKTLAKAEIGRRATSVIGLAGVLQVGPDRITSVLEAMDSQGLVTWRDDQLILTSEGRAYGLHMLRAHRLLERHLAERTGHVETEWHGLAERREHDLSPEEVLALAADLGYPTHDPHGDPIPMADGTLSPHGGSPLTRCEPGTCVRIVHVEDEPAAVYAQLVAEGLHPGMELRILDKQPQRIIFWADGSEHVIAPIVANNVSVVPVPELRPDESVGADRLADLRPGDEGKVVRIAPATRGPERRRLLDLGLTPGTIVRAELTGMGRDPTAYRVRGALIALRREQADRVHIIRLDPHADHIPG